ncbi:MAG: CocE/NonD family hydrolase [Hyphomicrobiaceae bacterium]
MPAPANTYTVIENLWVPLKDGARLAAKLWLPAEADRKPVPAILEYIPYRKRDGTTPRDLTNYPIFAAAGYAGVRVDIKGNGESDGLFDDEYSPRELAEAVEVLDWIAAQPWCTGAVGMMGISWGGFNALQVAALRPKPLKAVISLASTVDRYNDDIHYKNGCLLSANLSWSGNMLAYASRPADPAIVGDGWRKQWLERLDAEPLCIKPWLAHQRRDAYWQHGSICEDFSAIDIPCLVIAGWADGYRNTPSAAVAGLGGRSKGLVGPWIHKYPHFAWPRPRADFHGEALRWWDRWLKSKRTGAEKLPAYRAYITENIRPSHSRTDDAGRWVAEKVWPSPRIKARTYFLNTGGLLATRGGPAREVTFASPEDCGVMSGEFFTLRPDGDLAADQRLDDAKSLVFETGPLAAPLEILGRPRLSIDVAIDRPIGNLIARLVDVLPDGTAHRVAFGVLNLAHRNGNADPAPMTPGKAERIEIVLDECGHRFLEGHRLRLSLSTAYWPMVLPPPEHVTLTLTLGATACLDLPVRKGGDRFDVPAPDNPDPLPVFRELKPGRYERAVEHDLNAGRTRYRLLQDTGAHEVPDTDGLVAREVREEHYEIDPADPLSAVATTEWLIERSRGSWSIRTVTRQRLTADKVSFHIEASLEAFEGEMKVVERNWRETIPRDHM